MNSAEEDHAHGPPPHLISNAMFPRMRLPFMLAVVFLCMYGPDSRCTAASPNGPNIVDIELSESGLLTGRLVSRTGEPLPGRLIELARNANNVQRSTTDEQGCFDISATHGGLYQCRIEGQATMVRLWTHGTAPPVAVATFLMSSDEAKRGQNAGDWSPSDLTCGSDACGCKPCSRRSLLKRCGFCRRRRKCFGGCNACGGCRCRIGRISFPHLGFAAAAAAIVYGAIEEDDAS